MLSSMTSFGRSSLSGEWGQVSWELRSVNHRYLEPGFRLPEGLRHLELPLRDKLKQLLARGKVDCHIKFTLATSELENIQVNVSAVAALKKASQDINALWPELKPASVTTIASWPGIMSSEPVNLESIQPFIIQAFDEALAQLVDGRQREGQALAELIAEKVRALREHLKAASSVQNEIMSANQTKLLARFKQMNVEADQGRFEQELVYLAQKMDMTEELERFNEHLDEVNRCVTQGGVNGRRLDFLMQELNREANTLGSKSLDATLSKQVVDMKVLVEQMREQVQNIE